MGLARGLTANRRGFSIITPVDVIWGTKDYGLRRLSWQDSDPLHMEAAWKLK
jgi:hypothetical protein